MKRELARLARSVGEFDASRYFRGPRDLAFYNVGTPAMRALARSIYAANADTWSIDDAMALANALVADRYLEAKSIGIEIVARYKRDFSPRQLPTWKRWLAENRSANWATTDGICGCLIGPLLVKHPELADGMRAWSRHRNMWVRRASIVGLIPLARRGVALDIAYDVAKTLHRDKEDLVQKAVGWTLREAGKADPARLERYLRANGPSIPRTTVRYAIERFDEKKRRELLSVTIGSGYARAQPRDPSTLREPRGRGGAPRQMNEDRFKHKPRIEKLGVKAGTRVALIAVGDKDFSQEVRRVAEDVTIGRAPAGCDIIFFGAVSAKELVRVATLKTWMKPNGALWVIRPKGRPEISERAVMDAGKAAGLVDVKVVSFSETHTAEKFVIPLAAR